MRVLSSSKYFADGARNSDCGSMIYCFLVALEGHKEVPSQGEYSCVAWHLEEQVHIVCYCHEFSQRRSSQYGVVGRFEVSYFELDVLHPEVLFCTECDRNGN